jgi:CubicO group peptidase (beta-lactamase class C family)
MTGVVAAGAAELEAKLAAFVKENRLPGGAAGVVHGDEMAWSAGAGFADTGARQPTRPGTLYPDRVDHEDVHGDGGHAAARCGPAGPG